MKGVCLRRFLSPKLHSATQHRVKILIPQLGQNAKSFRPLDHSTPDRLGNLLGQQQQFVLVTAKFNRQLVNQLFGRLVPGFQLVRFDLGQIRKANANSLRQISQREFVRFSQLSDSQAESNRFRLLVGGHASHLVNAMRFT